MQKSKESQDIHEGAVTGVREQGVGASGPGAMASGMTDRNYNLVSILYHALKGADTYVQYISDAEADGDHELVDFFREVQTEEKRRVDRARELLAARIAGNQNVRKAA